MEFDKNRILNRAKAAQQSTVVMDEGLRAYMLKVYNYMATGILLTGIVALLTFKMSVVTNDAGSTNKKLESSLIFLKTSSEIS